MHTLYELPRLQPRRMPRLRVRSFGGGLIGPVTFDGQWPTAATHVLGPLFTRGRGIVLLDSFVNAVNSTGSPLSVRLTHAGPCIVLVFVFFTGVSGVNAVVTVGGAAASIVAGLGGSTEYQIAAVARTSAGTDTISVSVSAATGLVVTAASFVGSTTQATEAGNSVSAASITIATGTPNRLIVAAGFGIGTGAAVTLDTQLTQFTNFTGTVGGSPFAQAVGTQADSIGSSKTYNNTITGPQGVASEGVGIKP